MKNLRNRTKNKVNYEFKFNKKKNVYWLAFFNPFNYNKIDLGLLDLFKLFLLLNIILIFLFSVIKFSIIQESVNEINTQFFQQLNQSLSIKINILSNTNFFINIFRHLLNIEHLGRRTQLILSPQFLYVTSLIVLFVVLFTNALISLIAYELLYFIWNVLIITLFLYSYYKLTKEKIDFDLRTILKVNFIAFPWLVFHIIALPFNFVLAIILGLCYVISVLIGYLKIISRIFD